MAITSHIAPCPPDFPAHWRDILEENVAIYRRLPEGLTMRVEELMPWFIEKVSWEWSHWGAEVPDQELQKVCVACEACLLIARRSVKDYAHFKKFIFFPVDLTVVKENSDAVGDAWHSGKIRQGWEWTQTGMEDGADNYNVTIHEFAHMIDYRNTPSDSVPHFEDAAVEREYKAFMKSEYADICRAWKKKSGNDVIRKYATTADAEFFTCATEAYFERSEMLQFLRPRLYDWMKRIYGMDPVEWPERVSHWDLRDERRTLMKWERTACWKDAELPEWKVPAEQYEEFLEQEELQRIRNEREQERQQELIRQRLERQRLEQLAKEEAARHRRERERLERKERERFLVNNRTVMLEHPNGRPRLKYRLVEGHRDGKMQRWDEAGRLREETEYSRGRKHGVVVFYYADGQKELEGFFSRNQRAGIWRGWHEDGEPSFRSEYREGQLHTWEQFGENGQSRTYSKEKNRFEL